MEETSTTPSDKQIVVKRTSLLHINLPFTLILCYVVFTTLPPYLGAVQIKEYTSALPLYFDKKQHLIVKLAKSQIREKF